MLNTKKDILNWLEDMKIENYTINDDLSVDVKGNVNLSSKGLIKMPVQFGVVTGDFFCKDNHLTSLKGAPHQVSGGFNCNYNNLKDLEYSPKEVHSHFYCAFNELKSLKGSPVEVRGTFDCSNNMLENLNFAPKHIGKDLVAPFNKINSLEDCPDVSRNIYLMYNDLKTLKGIPQTVRGDLYCDNNRLTTLQNSPNVIYGNFRCSYNDITSLEFAPQIRKSLVCIDNPISNWSEMTLKVDRSIVSNAECLINMPGKKLEFDIYEVNFKDFMHHLEKDSQSVRTKLKM